MRGQHSHPRAAGSAPVASITPCGCHRGVEPLGLFLDESPEPESPSVGPLRGLSPTQAPNSSLYARVPQGPGPPERAWRKPAATLLAEVIHQDDLLQEGPGRCVQDAVHGPQEGGPGLVVEAEDDAGGGQAVRGRRLLQAPAGRRGRM